MAVPACAATWLVELDGSGDFTNIQPAVEAAASGDSVLVGPGRFDIMFSYTPPEGGWTDDVIVATTYKDLTIIGSGQDVTIIGPEVPPPWGMPGPIGFTFGHGALELSGFTIENMRDGIYHYEGSLMASHVSFRGNEIGMSLFCSDEYNVETCRFMNNRNGIYATGESGAPRLTVSDSEFEGRIYGYAGKHISAQSLNSVLVDGCTFRESTVSVQFDLCPGTISNCVVESGQGPHFSLLGSHTEMYDNMVLGGGVHIVATSGGWLTGSGNVFAGDSGGHPNSGSIEIDQVDVSLHGNHILKAPANGYVVECQYLDDSIVDLSDNYWGRVDPDWFALYIYDGHDSEDITTIVEFSPYSNDPVSNEDMSWSGLKDLFR